MKTTKTICLGAICLVCGLITRGSDWPQWRGPASNGVVTGKKLPVKWSEGENIVWKVPIPGAGWSQPVVADNKVFVTTAVTEDQRKPQAGDFNPFATADGPEPSRTQLFLGGLGQGPAPQPPSKTYAWRVLCLDAPSGKTLWERTARQGAPRTTVNRNNTYASETPATDGERLIAYFGNHGVYCYDLAGKLLWSTDLGAYPMQFGWGTGSSPVLHGDRVFIQCDNEQESFVVALDKATGDPVWRVARDEKSNWSTPYIHQSGLRIELIVAGGGGAQSYNPTTGDLLWKMSAHGRNSVTPVGDDSLLIVDSVDRLTGRTGSVAAIRPAASGDLSAASDRESSAFVAWRFSLVTTRVASPLLYQGCLYLLDQQAGRVRCYSAETGEEHYSDRVQGVRGFTASPWANEGKVFCLDERGTTVVLSAGPTRDILATNKLDDTFWSSVAVVDEDLLLRGVDHLYRVGNRTASASAN